MMNRSKENDEYQRRIENGAAYLHGRQELEIETFAKAIGCPSEELARRIGVLHLGLDQEWEQPASSVQPMRRRAAQPRVGLRKVAVGGRAQGRVPGAGRTQAREMTAELLTPRRSNPRAWRNKDGSPMTKAQRSREAARRRGKWSAKAKAAWGRHGKAA